MARFRLTAAHWLERGGVPQYCERGTEVDTAELPDHFVPTPHMAALDGDALTALVLECQRIRRTARGRPDVPAFGHINEWSRAEH
jgi:hypothetical protein